MSDDFFAELEFEITAQTAKKVLKSDAVKLKRQALNTKLNAPARAKAAEEYKQIQSIVEANQWQVVRAAGLFTEQHCDGCGSVHYNFLQYMQEEHKIGGKSRRWVRTPLPVDGLAIETIIQPLTTHICSDCCSEHGLNVLTPTIRLMPVAGALTVSAAYIQGDINGAPEES